MSSPLEDQVWKYITERRPLKLLFALVATVGICSSAVKTLEPAWAEAVRIARRYLDSKPSAEVREKYGCAYQTGTAYWTVSRTLANALSKPKSETWIANASLQEIRLCQRLFQFSPGISDIPSKTADGFATQEEWKLHFAMATNSWNEFQAYLATKDRQALALLRLGSELTTIHMSLNHFANSDPEAFSGPLHPDRKHDVVNKLQSLYDEAQSGFPYKLPGLELSIATAADLLRSIASAEAKFHSYFRGDA